jgi:hypothetical protein
MYLTHQVISQVLADRSHLAPGTELVTDYILTADLRDAISPALWQRADALHPIELSVLAHAVIH